MPQSQAATAPDRPEPLATLVDRQSQDRPAQTLDRANRLIIEELQRDGRRSYGAIANAVGLSEAAVRQRVQRLRDSGVIQIVAVTDPLQLGFRRQAMVGIKAEGDLRGLSDDLARIPEVEYVVICAGSFDLLVEVVCEDDDHLLELLNTAIRTVPGVRATEAFVYLKLAKQSYQWGNPTTQSAIPTNSKPRSETR